MRQVTLRDIGPITELTIPVPEGGGVVVLTGRNGKGKSRALEAISALTTGNGKVEHRDGAVRGEVEGFGAVLKVARQARRAGHLEVCSLEGRFSVLDLVDPKLKDPAAADAKRIKALIQLQGANSDASLFYSLVGGKDRFDELVKNRALDTGDLVTMAARIKRNLEDTARDLEDDAEKENIRAQAARETVAGIDLDAPDDARKLQEDLALAIAEEAKLKQQAQSARDAMAAAEDAGRQLLEAEAKYSGPGVGVATAQVETAKDDVAAAAAQVHEAERQLRAAKDNLLAKETTRKAAEETLYMAELHESTISQWRSTLGANLPPCPTDEQLAEASAGVSAAQTAIEVGARVRDAKAAMNRSSVHSGEAAKLRTEADRLREAAKGTDDVLSDIVQKLGCPLKVRGGRLVTPTDRSAEELFADLSRGEQWKLALDIAIDAVGEHGVLVVDQDGWEGLDPENRDLIARHLQGTGVVLITAECDAGELRAETIAA